MTKPHHGPNSKCKDERCWVCRLIRHQKYWEKCWSGELTLDLTMVVPKADAEGFYEVEVVPHPAGQRDVLLPKTIGPPPYVWIDGKEVGYGCGVGDNRLILKKPIPKYSAIRVRWKEAF